MKRIFLNILLDESISFLLTVSRLKLSTKCLITKKRNAAMETIGTLVANTKTMVMMIRCKA